MSKEAVKNELVLLKKSYRPFTVLSEPKKLPLIFTLTFRPSTLLTVDFDGVEIPFSVDASYPEQPPRVGNARSLTSQALPRGLLHKITEALQKQAALLYEKQVGEHKPMIADLLVWFNKNVQSIVLDPQYIEAYMAEGADGASRRRYAIIPEVHYASSESDSEDSDSDDDLEDEHEFDGATMESLLNPPPALTMGTVTENDIGLAFEAINMKNVSVFECSELNIVVCCGRCNKQIEVKGLIANKPFSTRCEDCDKDLSVRFYPCAVTQKQISSVQSVDVEEDESESHNRWAHIELHGAVFFDTLPTCTFRSLCFECSTVNEVGRMKLRAENIVACSKCHKDLVITVSGIRKEMLFELAQHSQPTSTKKSTSKTSASKKPKSAQKLLGIHEGSPLPNLGTCSHYRHSRRWLRFPCCGRAFPCDICHESQTGDSPVFANRMLCGYCSREQPCSDICKFCEKKVTKKVFDSTAKKHKSLFKTRSKKSDRVGGSKKKKKK